MRRPVACSVASSHGSRKRCRGVASRKISPPNDSAWLRVNYVTAERLYQVAGEMDERDWTVLSFVSATRLASNGFRVGVDEPICDVFSASESASERVLNE